MSIIVLTQQRDSDRMYAAIVSTYARRLRHSTLRGTRRPEYIKSKGFLHYGLETGRGTESLLMYLAHEG